MVKMIDAPASYDADIFAWSEQQAAVLRDLAQSRRDLSIQLDFEHVAEEVEDVGRSELMSVHDALRQIFIHLVKAVSVPQSSDLAHWRKETVAFHNDMLDRFAPSMAQKIDMATIWRRAKKEAAAALAVHEQKPSPDLTVD